MSTPDTNQPSAADALTQAMNLARAVAWCDYCDSGRLLQTHGEHFDLGFNEGYHARQSEVDVAQLRKQLERNAGYIAESDINVANQAKMIADLEREVGEWHNLATERGEAWNATTAQNARLREALAEAKAWIDSTGPQIGLSEKIDAALAAHPRETPVAAHAGADVGEELRNACAEFRDAVLYQRFQLAENGMTNDHVNDVLSLYDDTIGNVLFPAQPAAEDGQWVEFVPSPENPVQERRRATS